MTLLMYLEISCFVVCLSGWALVCSTMPTEYWNFSTGDGAVLTSSSYYSNLWKDCVSDSTGVSDCKEFVSMLALELYIHVCRALVIISIILGFSGSTLALIGMKCTKIGGSDAVNARVTFSAGVNYLTSGLCAMTAFCWYGNKIRTEFVNPDFQDTKYEFGAAIFVGWGGSSLLIIGGFAYCYLANKEDLFSSLFVSLLFPLRSKRQLKRISFTKTQTNPVTVTSLSLSENLEGRRTRTNGTSSKMPLDSFV
uniref:Si:ch211-181l5.2 n=1 Tax=Scleropages formosus TaxID=113540 RepID=A0A8C9QZ64_SCLFO